jgi:cytochrome c peroxidase
VRGVLRVRSRDWAIAVAISGSACGSSATTALPRPAADGGGLGAPSDGGVDVAEASADDPDPVITPTNLRALQALAPSSLPAPPPDPTNRFADDSASAKFGQKLFYDPSFSGTLLDTDNDGSPQTLGTAGQTGRVACAGCHVPSSGFSDTRSFQLQISLGAGWGRRRAPSLLDVGQATLLMWDGRRDALYNQVFGPLESVVEMNSSRLYEAEQIYGKYQSDYESIFGPMPPLADPSQFPQLSAQLTGCQPKNPTDPQPTCDGTFHGMPGDHAEFDGLSVTQQTAVTTVIVNAGKAMGAFERLLTCGPTSFDAWMRGSATAISRAAQRGAALFVGKAGCATCHSGPFLSDQQFHDVGLVPTQVQQAFVDSNDHGAATGVAAAIADPLNSLGAFSDGNDGRLPAAVTPAMEGAFRTPILRCVSKRPSFMHTGQLGTLAKVVAFFNDGGSPYGYLGASEIQPLGLTDLEQSDLVAFLESLDGPGADPNYLQAP